MNKLELVEQLAEEFECDYNAAFDLVYRTDYYGRDEETDDAL